VRRNMIKGTCLLHKKGMECPLVGPDRHCDKKPCHLEHNNPFIEEKKMTRVLVIKGTKIKLDIEMCSQCPLLAWDRDAMPDGCGLMRDRRYYEDSIDPDCPLPKRAKP
jgi:hypothetical protein